MKEKGQIALRRERIQRLLAEIESNFRLGVEIALDNNPQLTLKDVLAKPNSAWTNTKELIPNFMVDTGVRETRVIEYLDILDKAQRIQRYYEHPHWVIPKQNAERIFNEVKEAKKGSDKP